MSSRRGGTAVPHRAFSIAAWGLALVLSGAGTAFTADSPCTDSVCAAFCQAKSKPHAAADAPLSEEQIQKVLDWVSKKVRDSKGSALELAVDPEVIAQDTGVYVTEAHTKQLMPRVLAMLQGSAEGRALLAEVTGDACSVPAASNACASHDAGCTSACSQKAGFTSRCAEYGACSLYGDLSGATGDMLEMYVREKAKDGTTYENLALPAFDAHDLDGAAVDSKTLVGTPTVLVFLAGHCSHSFDTLPILQELERRYDDETLRVVGVYINSGSVEDVNSWIGTFAPEYDVWVEPTDALGDVIDSHLVPTYLLVDGEGRVRERLVGYKTPAQVDARLDALLGAKTETATSSGE